jgi:hypothetical protein
MRRWLSRHWPRWGATTLCLGGSKGGLVQLIAVSGKEPRAIQHDYGEVSTGQHEEILETPVVGTVLPNGAYLLYINDKDKIVPDDQVFTGLSKGASLIACYVNETAMNSHAIAGTDGVERWSVFHDPKQGIKIRGGGGFR